jgi:hypothetical protein
MHLRSSIVQTSSTLPVQFLPGQSLQVQLRDAVPLPWADRPECEVRVMVPRARGFVAATSLVLLPVSWSPSNLAPTLT